ncbi:unnamed protein product [Anisakis simplex]|uniref:HORMA domain-containing protein n=1 Tax=Anisakis simplex TaxID=6269 RepID=A0A0M3JWW2_ANISI|nr:unnamed protein product [Anisakis simplex]
MSNNIELDVSRCLCVHSSFQAIDIAIQSILYKRGFVPTLISQISTCADSRKEQAFAIQYNKMRDSLRELFRTRNRHHLRSVALLLGGCCVLPKEIYIFPIHDCHSADSEGDVECSSNCVELSKKEMRQLCLSLTIDLDLSHLPNLLPSASAYVLVEADTSVDYPSEFFTPYEQFELPSDEKANKHRISMSFISFKHHCMSECTSNSGQSIWLRVDPQLHRLIA